MSFRIKSALDLAGSQNGISDSFEFFRQFNEKREDWLEASEDYAKLHDFYKNQIDIWRRLHSKLNGSYKDNRSQLDLNGEARAALLRMEEILRAAEPYAMIREIDNLIGTVDEANNQILSGRREQSLQSIETRITQLKSELDSVNADADTRHAILYPFQQTKASIADQQSIQHIAFQAGEHAETLFQNALDAIELKRPKTVDPSGESGETYRPTRTVKPAQFASKTYIETAADLDEYLNKLRAEMEKLLAEKVRIRIQ